MFLKQNVPHIIYQGDTVDKNLKDLIGVIPFDIFDYIDDSVTEIRIRGRHNIQLISGTGITEIPDSNLSVKQINNILLDICDHTLSAFQNQISQGYITVPGGHRIGIGGSFYPVDNSYFIKDVYSLNVRINQNKKYCFDMDITGFSQGLLVAGPPHSGKTTFLKSLIDNISGIVVVCDERNELYCGFSNCDYIAGVPKYKAVEQATRSMNPDYIICDEIGDERESKRILSAVNSGVKFVCSVHGDSFESLYKKPNAKILMDNNVFDKIVILTQNKGSYYIKEVIDV